MSEILTENSSEEFLYSLGNCRALQGFFEDQFGLALIARAVEEGIAVIKPMGTMIFSMGGRPGQAICERLFLRRGLRIRKLWQTKIMQDANTDISALVEVEKNSPHLFEFFMDLVGDQPVSARTAWAYIKSGGRVSHSLSVYSCQLRQPSQVKKLFEVLKDGFHEVSSSLDLSFNDDSVADEKVPFLAYLASYLKENKSNSYVPPAGCLNFRNLVAEFMTSYHHILLTSDHIIIFPSVAVAIENILLSFSPALAIVGERLTRHLPKQWLTSSVIEGSAGCNSHAEDTVAVIEAPCQSDLLIELIRKLKPQVVVTGIAQFEAITSAVFVNLLSTTKDVGSRLFLDISEHLDLSNPPSSNGVLKYLAKNTLPSHAAILCGLKNQVYSDLEVAFAISEDTAVNKALSQTIELLEGHTSVISQKYYGCLFHELLVSQIGDRHAQQERQAAQVIPQNMIGFSNSAMSTLEETEFFVPDSKESGIIHMDLDRSLLPVPSVVKASIFESFVGQNITDSETNVGSIIEKRMESKYGFPGPGCSDKIPGFSKEIIFGSTCLALFNKLVLCCMQEHGTFFFPLGTNGHYVSAAKFVNANTLTIPTNSGSGFKIKPEDLEAALADVRGKKVTRPWVYIPALQLILLVCCIVMTR